MFAPEGYLSIGLASGIAVIVVLVVWAWLSPIYTLLLIPAMLLVAFVLYFFRDPRRNVPVDGSGSLLLAPADGKVIEVAEEQTEATYLEKPATRISIFLSPLNVHVNRIPASGVVEYAEYIPGKYLVAWHPKSSEENERSIIGLRHVSGRQVLFKQIAGAVARRVVFHVKVGDRVQAGDRFGIVKFGSRMDVLVPPDVHVSAKLGDRVRAGLTVLGRFPTGVAEPAVDIEDGVS